MQDGLLHSKLGVQGVNGISLGIWNERTLYRSVSRMDLGTARSMNGAAMACGDGNVGQVVAGV